MIKIFFSIIISLINAILVNRIVSHNKIITINSFLPGALFFLLSFPFILGDQNLEVTIILLLFVYMLAEIFKLNELKVKKTTFFNIGFTSSIIVLFNIGLLLNICLVLFALIYYKQFNWRVTLIYILGLICPTILIWIIYYLGADISKIIYKQIEYDSTWQIISNYSIFWTTSSILLIVSTIELYNNYYKKKDSAKRALSILFFGSTILMICSLFEQSIGLMFLLIIPISIIIPNYLLYTKLKNFRTFLLGLLTTILIINLLYI